MKFSVLAYGPGLALSATESPAPTRHPPSGVSVFLPGCPTSCSSSQPAPPWFYPSQSHSSHGSPHTAASSPHPWSLTHTQGWFRKHLTPPHHGLHAVRAKPGCRLSRASRSLHGGVLTLITGLRWGQRRAPRRTQDFNTSTMGPAVHLSGAPAPCPLLAIFLFWNFPLASCSLWPGVLCRELVHACPPSWFCSRQGYKSLQKLSSSSLWTSTTPGMLQTLRKRWFL